MFDILIKFVELSLSKVFDIATTVAQRHDSESRNVLSRLIVLYESTLILEHASLHAYAELDAVASGETVATKIVIANRLERLAKSLKSYNDALLKASTILRIYDGPLEILLKSASRKRRTIEIVSLASHTIPQPIKGENWITFNVTFPTQFPDIPSSLKNVTSQSRDREQLKLEAESLEAELGELFQKHSVDTRNADALRSFLNESNHNIHMLTESRKQLGAFIRNNFTLESLIK